MRFRKLRVAWTVFFAVLAVTLAVLWVRSYRYCESVAFVGFNQDTSLSANSGTIDIRHYNYLSKAFEDGSAFRYLHWLSTPATAQFLWSSSPIEVRGTVPFWFLMLIATTAGCLPWTVTSHFSLRTMLIVMTLVAVAIGLAVWLVK